MGAGNVSRFCKDLIMGAGNKLLLCNVILMDDGNKPLIYTLMPSIFVLSSKV